MKQPILGRHEDEPGNHAIVTAFPVYLSNGRYCGTLIEHETYAGVRWSHSLLTHGSVLFATSEAAKGDLELIKARLPASVHTAIFGREV
jgi:hypothetical protein